MWLHRYAVFVATCTFLALITGAWYTSLREAPEPANPTAAAVHLAAGVLVIAVTLALSAWLMKAGLGSLAWLALALVVLDGVLAGVLSGRPAPASHAVVSHLLFALAAAAAVCTSAAWQRGPEIVFDQGWPSLRSLAVITPAFVLAQVALGAAFRHKAMGLTWHIVGAMLVSILILLLGMFVLQQFPKHPALRPAAIALLTIAVAQVLLGIAAITTEMLATGNTVPLAVMLSTAAHVIGGSLTLAASLVLAILIRRNVQQAPEEPEEDEVSPAGAQS